MPDRRPPARRAPAPSPSPSPRSWAWRYRRLLFLVGLAAFTALAGAAFVLTRVPLPPERAQAQTSFLTDANGERLATLSAGIDRVHVALERVPPALVDAVVATEDKAYFTHGGLDPLGIARATIADLRGKSLQGGSTITQQYVKNVYLGSERTISRKLREAAIAMKVERKLSKREILERYLNTVYFGRGAYGVEAAARAYFGKPVQELGLREAAYLAGLIRAPVGADALRNPAEAERRRDLTLRAMVRNGAIEPADADRVRAEPLSTYVVEQAKADPAFALADKGTQYFVEYVRGRLVERYGEAAVYEGGLRVRTTLDLRMQAAAYDAVYGLLDRADDPAGALVSIDGGGHVKAMVGGRDFAASKVNLAIGAAGGGSGRQPGSTFKPFVLAQAVKDGYSVTSTLPAPAKIVFPRADRGADYPVPNFDDEEFPEPISLIDATAHSVNTVYAQLMKVVGPAKVVDLAKQAGIESPLEPNLSLSLGTSEVSVLEMASAFTTFANRGERAPPVTVLEVRTADGKLLERSDPERQRVLTTKVADTVTYCLQQVVSRGSGTAAAFGRPVAGKTGTTDDFGDAWFVGYTPRLTTAVWMGYPEGSARKMTNVRGRRVNGGSFPAGIFRRYMSAAVTLGDYGGSFPPAPAFTGRAVPVPSGTVIATSTTTSSSTTSTSTTTPAAPSGRPAPAPTSTSSSAPPPSSTTSSSTTSTTQKRPGG